MGKVRLLSLDDLYNFYVKQGKNQHFNADDKHTNIVVQVPASLRFEKTDKDTEALRPVVLQACHTGQNNNGSYIAEDVMKSAMASFSNRPILAYIHEVDGQPEFYTHCMHLDEDDNIVYDEVPIGTIPESCNAHLEYDEEKDKTYCVVNGYIYEEYAPKAIEIIEREGECYCSVELSVRELSYNSKEKLLSIDDYFYSGVTILGKTPDGDEVKPGMSGANIKLADFSAENNSFNFDSELINSIADAVSERLSNINNQRKEENAVEFEEKVEEVTEEIKVTESEETTEEDIVVDDSATDDAPEVVDDAFADEDQADDQENEAETNEEDIVDDTFSATSIQHSVTYGEVTKNFSVSLQDKIYALSTLVNETYSEADNTWYDVTVYDDEKYVVMKDWWNDKAFKQSYKVKKDVYSLVGDRVEVYAQYLTSDEIKKLDEMRANYSLISDKLAKYESEPEKMEILNSQDYSQIADSKEFAELKAIEGHFDMSVDEVRKAADNMLLAYAKNNKIEFAAEDKKAVSAKRFGEKQNKKQGRYGNLFKK